VLHQSHAVAAANILCWILTGRYEYGGHYIRGVGVETAYAAGNGGPDHVLRVVDVDEGGGARFQHFLHDLRGDDRLAHHRLPPALDPATVPVSYTVSLDFFPTHQLTAAGFLSVQKLPLRLKISMSGNSFCTYFNDISVPFDTMFIPMASPVFASNRTNKWRPAILINNFDSLANRLLASNCSFMVSKFCEHFIHAMASLQQTKTCTFEILRFIILFSLRLHFRPFPVNDIYGLSFYRHFEI
jgi:hypothetical protein